MPEMFWPLLVLAMVGIVAVEVWFTLREKSRGKTTHRLYCPEVNHEAEVTFLTDILDSEHYDDVLTCSEFDAGEPVTCERICLGFSRKELVARR